MNFTVNIDGKRIGAQKIECADDNYVLDAAEEAGIDLPYSCSERIIYTRGASWRITKTRVPSCIRPILRLDDDQTGNGFVRRAIAYPTSDCTIKTHMEEELY